MKINILLNFQDSIVKRYTRLQNARRRFCSTHTRYYDQFGDLCVLPKFYNGRWVVIISSNVYQIFCYSLLTKFHFLKTFIFWIYNYLFFYFNCTQFWIKLSQCFYFHQYLDIFHHQRKTETFAVSNNSYSCYKYI